MNSTDSAFEPAAIIAGLPHLPGVYRYLDAAGEVLYVGKARDLKKRVASYFQKADLSPRIRLMLSHVRALEITVTRSESEALLLESNLIKALAPRYNIVFRDDKSYPYVVLSEHEAPRLAFQRGAVAGGQCFGPYPHAQAVKESIQILQKAFRLRTCEDSVYEHRSRPCLLHQIQRCTAPCVGLIKAAAYQRDVADAALFLSGRDGELITRLQGEMQAAADALRFEAAARLRDQVLALNQVREQQFVESRSAHDADILAVAMAGGLACVYLMMVRGGRSLGGRAFFPAHVVGADSAGVLEAFVAQHYAHQPAPDVLIVAQACDAASWLQTAQGAAVQVQTRVTGERRAWLDAAQQNATLALTAREGQRAGQEVRLAALNAALLGTDDGVTDATIARIECFDASHTQGEATVVSCVVYDRGMMQNAEYRRFNVTPAVGGDDYAALREALLRRYEGHATAEGAAALPDLVLIDGGRGQVNVAQAVLDELGLATLRLLGVAKGEARKAGLEQLIWPDEAEALRLPPDHPGLHLIQQIRDEAHRFAITGHRARRAKARVTSSLEGIAGIGAKRRQRLLQTFGGLRGVQSAGIEEIAQVDGISRALAEQIYAALHT
ncbi:MAG: excinuclease ABC subunit UvrC [Betaproteobacteria bacterium]|nr:MAG: excinuclease ABC subunit UvrC [Betaproteobacteria bacterium]